MKIALASAPVKNNNIEFNVKAMLDAISENSGMADAVIFGESVLQGFNSLCWNYEKDRLIAVTVDDINILHIREAARENSIAVSFGFIERSKDNLYSSQIFIGADGKIIDLFHRVSIGWKEYTQTDEHYCEGKHFNAFEYEGKRFAMALCGDLWTDGRPEEMKAVGADAVLWPVWCDYNADKWNNTIKYEYAKQAEKCGDCVLLVNPYDDDDASDNEDKAAGGAICFKAGMIEKEMPAGEKNSIIIEI